jgi:hypothetical protein
MTTNRHRRSDRAATVQAALRRLEMAKRGRKRKRELPEQGRALGWRLGRCTHGRRRGQYGLTTTPGADRDGDWAPRGRGGRGLTLDEVGSVPARAAA